MKVILCFNILRNPLHQNPSCMQTLPNQCHAEIVYTHRRYYAGCWIVLHHWIGKHVWLQYFPVICHAWCLADIQRNTGWILGWHYLHTMLKKCNLIHPHMVNQTQDGFSIMRLQGTFLFFSALWALGMTSFVCRIGWEWFLSWDHQYWELFI